ncbi:MAG: trypsin-like serine protease [Phycisphaeraceae bacterium]
MKTWTHDYWHRQLGQSSKYNSVGQMVMESGGVLAGYGSGTLIGDGQWVLTASHVVDQFDGLTFRLGDGEPDSGFSEERTYTADSWYVHSGWANTFGSLSAGYDIALVRLNEVADARPANLIDPGTNDLDDDVTYVGFGSTGTGMTGTYLFDGIKRAGTNTVYEYEPASDNRITHTRFDQSPEDVFYSGPAWDFVNGGISASAEDYPRGLEYGAGPGDSGGAMFRGDTDTLAGVISYLYAPWTFLPNGTYHDYTGAVRVEPFLDWIHDTINTYEDEGAGGAFTDALVGTPGNPALGVGFWEDLLDPDDETIYNGRTLAERWILQSGHAGLYALPMAGEPGHYNPDDLNALVDPNELHPELAELFEKLSDEGLEELLDEEWAMLEFLRQNPGYEIEGWEDLDVPEPATIALFGLGTLALLRRGRRSAA